MKAILQTTYGPPEVLRLAEIDTPAPEDNEVRIRVDASTVTAVDCTFRAGKPFIARLFNGVRRPKHLVPGTEFAGVVDAIGPEVSRFKPGDRVYGTSESFGAHAEYLCLPEEGATLAHLPEPLNAREAVASDGFLTALPFLRDAGGITAGQKVLVYGASGSVGSAAVQLARHLGADVTGVCGATNVDLVRSLGAHRVIDYRTEDYTRTGETWDIIFDTVGKTSFSMSAPVLAPRGIFLETTISTGIMIQMLRTSKSHGRRAKIIFTGMRPGQERTRDLKYITGLLLSGAIRPVIDRTYPLEKIAEAHRYVETGHKKGNVVITVGHDGG